MTRLIHIFRHLSAAAKKTGWQHEWKTLRRAVSKEEAAVKAEVAMRIRQLESELMRIKRHQGSGINERLLTIEERIIGLKRALIGKGN
ncbi:hypothetical protein HYV82_02210 [Candidatus Woesearchaeota archaeon]|nr:hypothetical protein [Candidatus Woesearchaeota archaeon]